MRPSKNQWIKFVFLSICLLFTHISFAVHQKGIYISTSTAHNTGLIKKLIKQSKSAGINTFIVDITSAGPKYKRNVRLIQKSGIKYVARVVVFPKGGNKNQLRSEKYWNKKWKLAKKAINLGASEIQLDYIRYSSKNKKSSNNVNDVHKVIKWFKKRTDKHKVKLQIDIFGEAAYKHSKHIGQDVTVFANSVDAVCPMLYPSHFEPYKLHAKTPYKTVHRSLQAMKKRFKGKKLPFKVYPYIELSNYRYKMGSKQKLDYIKAQIKAANDANTDGWYVWSANNKYSNLFKALKSM